MAKILIAEDDRSINQLIAMNLQLVGHTYTQVYNGRDAVTAAFEDPVDLILLDVMLPEMDGFEVIKQVPFTPVIFITAKDGLTHRLNGLALGADDYIAKPFNTSELLARIEAVLRRTQKHNTVFSLNNTVVDLNGRTVTVDGMGVDLSPREFELLEVLIKKPEHSPVP